MRHQTKLPRFIERYISVNNCPRAKYEHLMYIYVSPAYVRFQFGWQQGLPRGSECVCQLNV